MLIVHMCQFYLYFILYNMSFFKLVIDVLFHDKVTVVGCLSLEQDVSCHQCIKAIFFVNCFL